MKAASVKKWLNHIVSVLLIGVIVTMVFLVVSSKLSGGTPKVMGKELLTVLSGSMEPDIKTGSIIAITPAEKTDAYQTGDVITYRSLDNQEVLITHRIEGVETIDSQMHYLTKGDNNDAADPSPIPASNVVGKYTGFTIPYIGYALNFIKTEIGIILLVIIPGVLLILWSAVSLWRAIAGIEDSPKAKKPKTS